MTPEKLIGRAAKRSVETPARLNSNDLDELCDAADEAILSGWFWLASPPPRSVMEDYWRGVQMIPERHLVVVRLDKVIAGSRRLSVRRATTRRGLFLT